MRHLKSAAIIVFVAAIPLFLIATNIRWVVNAPILYSYGFDKYDIPYWTGIERDELLSAGSQIRNYFNNDADLLDIRVEVSGATRNIYNVREIEHMRDVKGLVRGVYRVQEVTAAYLLLFISLGFWFAGRGFFPTIILHIRRGATATIGLVLIAGIGSLVGFESLFRTFHIISFSNDLWQLDPSHDYLIAMFPEGFFFDATMWVSVSTVAEALLLTLGALYYLWWLPQRLINRQEPTGPVIEPSS